MNFYTFMTLDSIPIQGYIKADNKEEAIEKALARWHDADPKSCRIYKGIL